MDVLAKNIIINPNSKLKYIYEIINDDTIKPVNVVPVALNTDGLGDNFLVIHTNMIDTDILEEDYINQKIDLMQIACAQEYNNKSFDEDSSVLINSKSMASDLLLTLISFKYTVNDECSAEVDEIIKSLIRYRFSDSISYLIIKLPLEVLNFLRGE